MTKRVQMKVKLLCALVSKATNKAKIKRPVKRVSYLDCIIFLMFKTLAEILLETSIHVIYLTMDPKVKKFSTNFRAISR